MQSIFYYLRNPKEFAVGVLTHFAKYIPSDKLFLQILYRIKFGRKLNLIAPLSYNEKLQWLKLYNRKPEYAKMVDKYAVKDYVGQLIGRKYIIPTYALWNNESEIDVSDLPEKFVLKTTHSGGCTGIVLCKDKSSFDIENARKTLHDSLQIDLSSSGYREWVYKHVPKKIIAEMYLEPEIGDTELHDYKVMCFNGLPKLIEYHSGRFAGRHTQDFYDCNWNKLDISQKDSPISNDLSPKPEKLEEMLQLSMKLSQGIPHVRVDWYIVRNQIYFGELTFFDAGGFCPFDRFEDDLLLGSWIILPPKTINN